MQHCVKLGNGWSHIIEYGNWESKVIGQESKLLICQYRSVIQYKCSSEYCGRGKIQSNCYFGIGEMYSHTKLHIWSLCHYSLLMWKIVFVCYRGQKRKGAWWFSSDWGCGPINILIYRKEKSVDRVLES